MLFCPTCANLLMASNQSTGMFFTCKTCPYQFKVQETVATSVTLPSKQIDDVLGGAAAWENAAQTTVVCPKCSHDKAYFMQIQIRSADEPSTVFYKCVACGGRWHDN